MKFKKEIPHPVRLFELTAHNRRLDDVYSSVPL